MVRAVHLVSDAIPGYALADRKCVPYSVKSKRIAVPYYSLRGGHKFFQNAKFFLNNFQVHGPRRVSFVCKAIANNDKKNPDFSRQRKGSSRGKSRRHQDRDNSENPEETDLLSSKNGPIPSLSSSPRYQATATPGRREREILELFRKVQKQLRERAAIKEEKKIEASQQGQGERGTVDSLLKLLRKHSADQKKKIGLEEDITYDQSERSNPLEDDQNANFFESSSINSKEVHAPEDTPLSRPASNFRRRSPVPRVKFQPVYSPEESVNSNSSLKSHETLKDSAVEPKLKPTYLDEHDDVKSDNLSDVSGNAETSEETIGPSDVDNPDLSSLKLLELRELAKSRGIRGYSKLKKGQLVELLSQNGPL